LTLYFKNCKIKKSTTNRSKCSLCSRA